MQSEDYWYIGSNNKQMSKEISDKHKQEDEIIVYFSL